MNNASIEALVRPNIRSLCPYSTARDEYQGSLGIFLDANENPYDTEYNRYPDPHQKELKTRISEIKGLPVENIFLGNGSDEAIDMVFRVFCNPGVDNVVAICPSYGMYGVAAATNDIQVRSVLLGEDFSLPVDQLLQSCDANTKAIFLCSPNNPSGNAFATEDLLHLVESFKGIVVLDEAYADFSRLGSLRSKVLEYPNLIVLQTLSKAWGMAGLRCGLAFAQEYIIRLMSMVKYPYNLSSLVQKTVLEALQKPIDSQVEEIVAERGRVAAALEACPEVLKVWPSDANFILARFRDAGAMYNHLLACGIIVRNRNSVPLCQGCLRITIGTPAENEQLFAALEKFDK